MAHPGRPSVKRGQANTRRRRIEVVVGTDIPGESLIVVEKWRALELAAFRKVKTWGEFRQRAPKLYRWALEILKECAWPDPWKRPGDSDKLVRTAIYHFEDGDFPWFPQQLMLTLIPEGIQHKYGLAGESAINGEMLQLDPERKDDIVRELEQRGFVCEENQDLIDAFMG